MVISLQHLFFTFNINLTTWFTGSSLQWLQCHTYCVFLLIILFFLLCFSFRVTFQILQIWSNLVLIRKHLLLPSFSEVLCMYFFFFLSKALQLWAKFLHKSYATCAHVLASHTIWMKSKVITYISRWTGGFPIKNLN